LGWTDGRNARIDTRWQEQLGDRVSRHFRWLNRSCSISFRSCHLDVPKSS
jgi:hypothetical protein